MRYIQFKRNTRRIRAGLLCILVCMVFFGCGKDSSAYFEEEHSDEEENISMDTEQMEEDVVECESVCVFVCGQVKYPDVYELQADARICDAIEAAGGMTDKASTEYWNLAEKIQDGQKIYVPTEKEVKQSLEGNLEQMPPSGEYDKVGEAIDDGKININTASLEQLMTLSGIGESRAQGIITYRTEHGAFTKVEDIMNVSGIGNAIFSKMKDQITV